MEKNKLDNINEKEVEYFLGEEELNRYISNHQHEFEDEEGKTSQSISECWAVARGSVTIEQFAELIEKIKDKTPGQTVVYKDLWRVFFQRIPSSLCDHFFIRVRKDVNGTKEIEILYEKFERYKKYSAGHFILSLP